MRAVHTPGKMRLSSAFTLLEVLVSCAVLTMLLMMLASVTRHAGDLWTSGSARVEAFQGARAGFENMTRLLSQATLNTYWDYDNPNNPTRYIRKSELHFLVDDAAVILGGNNYYGQAVFFQAPGNFNASTTTGTTSGGVRDSLTGLLNACGFFVEYSSDAGRGWLPSGLDVQPKERYRLMMWLQPSQELSIYSDGTNSRAWLDRASQEAVPVADNIIVLAVWPKEPDRQAVRTLPDQYHYDSREGAASVPQPPNANQLPPLVQVAMVAIDEASALRLGDRLKSTIDGCLAGLFEANPSTRFESDLQKLEENLARERINYRVFTSVIPLKEAKWSPNQ